MKNKNFGWPPVYAYHFVAPRRLLSCCAGHHFSVNGANSFSFLLAGRLAVIAAILTFITAYLYGISQYGWKLGMAIGWLPAMTLTWLTAQALAFGIRYIRNKEIVLQRYHAGGRLVQPSFCCRGRTNAAPQYRRQINFP